MTRNMEREEQFYANKNFASESWPNRRILSRDG